MVAAGNAARRLLAVIAGQETDTQAARRGVQRKRHGGTPLPLGQRLSLEYRYLQPPAAHHLRMARRQAECGRHIPPGTCTPVSENLSRARP